jgi:hypothetical protein
VGAIAPAAHRRDERQVAGRAWTLGAKVAVARDALARPEQPARQVLQAAAASAPEQQASWVLQQEPQELVSAVSLQVAEQQEQQVLRQPGAQEQQEEPEQSPAQQAWPLPADALPEVVVSVSEPEAALARRPCAARPWRPLLSRLVRLRRQLPHRRRPADGASPFRRHRQG